MIEGAVSEQLSLSGVPSGDLERTRAALERARKAIKGGPAKRGRRYRKRVGTFQAASDAAGLDYVWVEVAGSRSYPYEVAIELWEDGSGEVEAEAVCSCPYSMGSIACKHVWAALAQFEALIDEELRARAARSVVEAPEARRTRRKGREPGWKLGLRHLDRFLSEAGLVAGGSAADQGEARVVWRVSVIRGAPYVEAYEQKRQARGGYSRGRKVSLERLVRSQELWTRPEVRAVARLVREEQGYRYYGRYRSVEYVLDHGRALLELIGSPYVSWRDRPEQAVEVRRGELGFELRARSGDELEMVPVFGGRVLELDPTQAEDVELVVVGDRVRSTITVGEVKPAALELAARLSPNARVFPKASQAELLQRLEQLEEILPVSVPEELQGGVVEADPRLRLFLTPLEDALRVQARVRPAGRGAALEPGGAQRELTAWVDGKRVTVRRDLEAERSDALATLAELGLGGGGGLTRPGPGGDKPRPYPEKSAPVDAEREAGAYGAEGEAGVQREGEWSWRLEGEAALDLVSALQDVGDEQLVVEWPEGERLSVSREAAPEDLRVAVRDRRDWFGLEGTIEVDGWSVPLAAVLDGLKRGDRYLPLEGGRWLKVSRLLRERLGALGEVVRRAGKAVEVDGTAGPVVQQALKGAGELEVSEGWEELQARIKKAKRVSTKPPRALQAELRPYQREGFAWLKRLATWGVGACLADDMGLGKTVQAIAALVVRARQGPALVVAPTSVGANWIREVERFAPRLKPVLYRETERCEMLDELGPRDVVIISYDLARIDIEGLREVEWSTLVFDEAQQVKNANTKTARALRELSGGWRLALTGTPLENHLGELWSLFRLISPGVFGSWEAFKERFALPIERDGDAGRREALARLIRPFILRRTKAEVLTELPRRTDVQVDVELSKRELRLYEQARLEAIAELVGGDEGRDKRFLVLAALTRLRQLACHPRLVDASWDKSSAKLDALLSLVAELREGEHRALVFSQFTRHLGLLREALDARGVSYLYLDGKTPARKRQELVDAFQAGEGELFLISLKAGGKGLNLTGADYVVHLDPWWNPAVEDQATDRAHRIGQTKPVTVYRLVANKTIEEQILALHADKRDLVAGVLDGADRAGKLSTDELMALIRNGPRGSSSGRNGTQTSRGRAPAQQTRAAKPGAHSSSRSPRVQPSEAAGSSDAASQLVALRERHGLTQTELGLLLGVSAATVCRWERGSVAVPAKRAAKLDDVDALTRSGVTRRLNRLLRA